MGMGLGAGPIRRKVSPILLRRTLRSAQPLAVRDRDSMDLLARLGLQQATATADLVLSSPTPRVTAENRIVVCLRPHKPGGGLMPVAMQRDRSDDSYLDLMAMALDDVARTFDTECRFVAFEPARDHPFHQQISARMQTPTSLCIPEYNSLLEVVGRSRGVIAMRYHSAIAAIITTRPTVMIGYAPKVTSLAADLGDGFDYLPNEASRFEELPAKLRSVIDVDPAKLTGQLDQLREAESKNESLLRAALSSDGPP